jgi:surface protein
MGIALGNGNGIPFQENPTSAPPAALPFETRWTAQTDNYTIELPYNSSSPYSGTIDWGDGTAVVPNSFANRSHTYATAGDYNIKIFGDVSEFVFSPPFTNSRDLKEVLSWGPFSFARIRIQDCKEFIGGPNCLDVLQYSGTIMSQFFYDAETMVSVQFMQNWDVSGVASLDNIFYDNNLFNQNINTWNTSGATTMSNMFNGAAIFNQPLSNFDTSSVVSLNGMFAFASQFNQDLSSWDTSSVTNLQSTFYQATSFNDPSVNSWDVSNVTTFFITFSGSGYNQPLNNWNTSSAVSMRRMFYNNSVFNQEISNFDTSGVTDMREMFRNSTSFNKDLGSWDFSSITQMDGFMTGKTDANYSSANYDSLLSALVLGGQSNVTLGMGTIKYSSSGVADRASLVARGWTITDGGQV